MKPTQLVRLFVVGIAALLALMTYSSAFAGQPVTQTLNPPPPSFETCKAIGSGTICAGDRTISVGPYDTGIVCGNGTSAFDIFDTATLDQSATRYYDQNGNLTRRVSHDDFDSGQFSNPLTGAVVPYTQVDTSTDVLAVPGDFGSATNTTTGENIFRPAQGAPVFLNAGRFVTAPDGTIEFRAGPQGFLDYFVDGDTSVIQKLCAALQ